MTDKPMTVGELIERLKEFGQDLPVYGKYYDNENYYSPTPIDTVFQTDANHYNIDIVLQTDPYQYNEEFSYVLIA